MKIYWHERYQEHYAEAQSIWPEEEDSFWYGYAAEHADEDTAYKLGSEADYWSDLRKERGLP